MVALPHSALYSILLHAYKHRHTMTIYTQPDLTFSNGRNDHVGHFDHSGRSGHIGLVDYIDFDSVGLHQRIDTADKDTAAPEADIALLIGVYNTPIEGFHLLLEVHDALLEVENMSLED